MRTRALCGRADVQADERRPCRRCMAAVNLSVDATVIAIASHDSLDTSTRAGSTARSYDLTAGFFGQPRLEYLIERVLLIDRCRLRSCAVPARYRKAASGQAPTIGKRQDSWLLLRMQKATSIARPNPACGCCEAPRSRRAPPPM